MMKRNLLITGIVLSSFSVILLSCDGTSNNPENPDVENPDIPKDTVLYAVGQEAVPDAGYYYAAIWKDGVRSFLTDGTADGFCNAVSVYGDSIYVVGCEAIGDLVDDGFYEPYHLNTAVLWSFKAGGESDVKRRVLSDGKMNTSPLSVCVSDGNVYIAGMETPSYDRIAVYWKNGQMQRLTDGKSDAIAYCVYATGGDVYVGGYEATSTKYGAAVIWKNGAATRLTDGASTLAKVNAVFVENGTVYAAGAEKGDGENWKGVLWTDGTPSYFHTESEAIITGLYVKNGNYIIGGSAKNADGHYVPCSWTKDGITYVSEDVKMCTGSAMTVSGDDVYLAGNEYFMDMTTYEESYTPYLWKNGKRLDIETTASDASIYGLACAYVDKK